MEEISSRPMIERRARPQEQLNCPRCNSTNTKFCYYNNYSLTQPRYFCKTCRRYWTDGGSLRNVPVGGGSRKNKRPILTTPSSSTSAPSASSKLPDLNPPTQLSQFSYSQNPKIHECQDLNLAFPTMQDFHPISHHQYVEAPKIENTNNLSSSASTSSHHLSALELLRTGINASRGLNSFIPVPVPDSNTIFSSGFPFQELKPSIGFSVHHEHGNRYGSVHGVQENGDNQNKEQVNSNGYWNGMFGGGSW